MAMANASLQLSGETMVKTALELFDTFVVYENAQLSQEMLQLLASVFIDRMVEKDW